MKSNQEKSKEELIEQLEILNRENSVLKQKLASANSMEQDTHWEQEKGYKYLIENINDVIFEVDNKGTLKYISPSVFNATGYSPNDFKGKTLFDFVYSPDIIKVKHQYNTLPNDVNRSIEFRHKTKDGNIIWVKSSSKPIFKNNQIIGRIGILQNIEKQKQAELKLEESEEKYRSIVESINEVVYEVDLLGTIVFTSQSTKHVLSYEVEEVIGHSIFDHIFEDDISMVKKALATLETKTAKFLEYRYLTKNNEIRWVRSSTAPKYKDGVLVGGTGVLADITDKKIAEDKLKALTAKMELMVNKRTKELKETNHKLCVEIKTRSKAQQDLKIQSERLFNIIEGARLGSWEWNVQTGDTIFNKRWAQIVGYKLEELEPCNIETWIQLTHPTDLKKSTQAIENHFSRKTDYYSMEIRMKHKKGHWVWIWDIGKVIEWSKEGKPLWMYGMHMDITEKKDFERNLKVKTDQLEKFFSLSVEMLCIADNTGSFIKVNQAWEKTLGFTAETLESSSFIDLIHPDDRENAIKLINSTNGHNNLVNFTCRFRHKLGKYRKIAWNSFVSGKLLYAVASDVTEKIQAERFDKELLKLSSELTGISYDNINAALNYALKSIGEFLDTDRSYIFQFNDDHSLMNNSHEWCSNDITAEIDNLQNIPCKIFPNWMKTLQENKIIEIQDVKSLGEEWIAEKEILEPQGIKSLIVLPLMIEDHLIGFVGLDNVRNNRKYLTAEINTLRVWSVILSGLLQSEQTGSLITETKQNFETFFNTIKDFLLVLDLDGNILHSNKTVQNQLGYSRGELYDKSILSIFPPQNHEEAVFYLNEILAERVAINEIPFYSKKGKLLPVENSAIKGKWNNQNSIFWISRDISEKINTQNELKQSEARWQFALESSGDGIWDYDFMKQKIFFSQQWVKLFGYEDDNRINNPSFIKQIIYSEDLKRAMFGLNRHILTKSGIFEKELRAVTKDGDYKWILAKGKIISYGETGTPIRMIGTLSDISARKNFETSLTNSLQKERELSEMKSRFVSMTSHEFRTPLATILMSTEMLEIYRARMTEDDIKNKIIRIKDNVNYLRDILEKVLNLSQIETGKIKFQPEIINFNTLLNEIVDNVKNDADTKHVIKHNLRQGNLEMYIDVQMIKQSLKNLLNNSIKYSPVKSTITIWLEKTDKYLKINIEDQGIGIKKEDQNKILKPFNRGSNVNNIQGTGLGLSLAQNFIQYHGGDISFISEPNVRTVFTVRLPLFQ